MKPATIFALHFARLFSQLVHDPDNQEASRATVDELLADHRQPVTLAWNNWQLVAEGDVLPLNMPGVKDVVARMAAHGVREMTFAGSIEPGNVLGAVWILAKEPVIGDGGANALAGLAKLGARGVQFVAVAAPPIAQGSATPAASEMAMSLDFELFEPEVEASKPEPVTVAPRVADTMFQQFTVAAETPEVLVGRLKSLTNIDQLARTMESLANLISDARSEQKIGDAADLLTEVTAAEPRFTDPAAKRIFNQVMRRIVSHSLLLSLAADLPRSRPRHAQYMALFARFGDDAVDALIEQLIYAELAKERRVLFNAIVELRRGVAALIRMLSDTRWYVARNAAELLGEMRAGDAEAALVKCLHHDDARVRRSAAAALAKMGTAGALAALTAAAMRDPSPNVRMQATLAIAMRKEPRSTAVFLRALADEVDPDVQRALLTALGRIGTPEAVRRLIAESAPDNRLFKKKPVLTRVAAIQALAEARTAEAITALEALTKDKEREVREAAAKGLAASPGSPGGRPQTGW